MCECLLKLIDTVLIHCIVTLFMSLHFSAALFCGILWYGIVLCCVILRRYGLGFLQENKNKGAVAVGNERIETISLSDAQTPAAAREIVTAAAREGIIPQHTPNRLSETHPLTLSEILEVEVPLLE